MFTKEQKPNTKTQEQNKQKDQFFQPKLKMGKPGDAYEVEADKMADKVVNKTTADTAVQSKGNEEEIQQKPLASEVTPLVQKKEAAEEEVVQQMPQEEEALQKKGEEEEVQMKEEEEVQAKEEEEVQAKCADCEKEGSVQKKEEEEVQNKEEEEVQAKEANSKPNTSNSSFESKLRNGNGGQQLDHQTRQEMESGFGADFSGVNIHNDSHAQQMSQEIGAQAFTHGNDIYFNEGKYNPDSKEGKHLLAHELTHTIQQNGMVSKKEATRTNNTIQSQPENSNPPADLACPVANTNPSGIGETLSFPVAGSSFTTAQKEGINNFVRNWHLAKEPVRIDGYASEDGAETFNWHLSCRRAQTAKNALMAPPDGSPGIPASFIEMYAHGETDQFGSLTQNRRVSINLPTSLPVTPTLGAPEVTHKTVFTAPDGTSNKRKKVAVGEEVKFEATAVGDWSADHGTPLTKVGSNKFKWTAPNRAKTATITFKSGIYTVTKVFEVLEPNAITGTNKREITTFAPGTQGVGMFLEFKYHPLNVSFGNVEAKEVSHPAANTTGYYLLHGMPHHHNTGDTFFPIGSNNIDTATDEASQSGYPSPWSEGGFDWDIPNHFKVKTEGGDGKEFTKVDQDFRMIDATGKTKISKAGLDVERTP